MGHGRLKEEISATEFPGWIEYLLRPTKEDFYAAQIAWHIYRSEIRWCGIPKGEKAKTFKDFFLDRTLPKNSKGEEVEDEEVPEETDEEIRERKRKMIAENAKLSVMVRLGLPADALPPEMKNGNRPDRSQPTS